MTADPLAVLQDQLGVLGESLAQRDQGADKAAARRAASAAVGAIDAMLRELYPIRGRLVREISTADEALRQEGEVMPAVAQAAHAATAAQSVPAGVGLARDSVISG